MTRLEKFQSMTSDELAEWLYGFDWFEGSPWVQWWDKNYCSKCGPVTEYVPEFDRECECAWCELNNKCKFFSDMDDVPGIKMMIKMWLESEAE